MNPPLPRAIATRVRVIREVDLAGMGDADRARVDSTLIKMFRIDDSRWCGRFIRLDVRVVPDGLRPVAVEESLVAEGCFQRRPTT